MKNLESVFAAYMFVWAILFAYLWSVSRRVARLREELDRKKKEWEG
jgi:CcmD family protein